MEMLAENDLIYKYKHQLEYADVLEQLKQVNFIFSHSLFYNKLPLKQIVKPLGHTKNFVFETDIFYYNCCKHNDNYTYIERNEDNIKNFNIKHRYHGHERSATIKLRIKFKNYQTIYLYEILNIMEEYGAYMSEGCPREVYNVKLKKHNDYKHELCL